MKIDTIKTNKAISEITASGEKVTLKGIANLTGYTYEDLYSSRQFDKYVKTSRLARISRQTKQANLNAYRNWNPVAEPTMSTSEPLQTAIKHQLISRPITQNPVPEFVGPPAPKHPYFPLDGSGNMVWRTGTQEAFGLIQIKGLTFDDDFNLDIFAFMLLKAYNKVTGRRGKDRLVHEANQIKTQF